MPDLAKIILRNHKIDAVKRFHPWIFSGAIKEMEGEVKEGAIVEVYSDRGEYLATGLYNPSNIAVKILSFQTSEDDPKLHVEIDRKVIGSRHPSDATMGTIITGSDGSAAREAFGLVFLQIIIDAFTRRTAANPQPSKRFFKGHHCRGGCVRKQH